MKKVFLRYARKFKEGKPIFQMHFTNFPTAKEVFIALGSDLVNYDDYARKDASAIRDVNTDIVYFHTKGSPYLFSINPHSGSWGSEKAFNDTINLLNKALVHVYGKNAPKIQLIEEEEYAV